MAELKQNVSTEDSLEILKSLVVNWCAEYSINSPTHSQLLDAFNEEIKVSELEIVKSLLIKAIKKVAVIYYDPTYVPTDYYFKKHSLDYLFQIFKKFGGLINPHIKSDVVVEYYCPLFVRVSYNKKKQVGPTIIYYSINPEKPENFLKVISEKWLFEIKDKEIYSRPLLEGPASIRYFAFNTKFKSYKFYAEEDIITGPITDEPAISCITFNNIVYNIYVVDGYPYMMTCKNSNIRRIDFCPNTGQQLNAHVFEEIMNRYSKYMFDNKKHFASCDGFISSSILRIFWMDGTIYTFLDEENYIKEIANVSKEWFKIKDKSSVFWQFPLDPDMGIPHRCEFSVDETGSEGLLPAKMFLANPELNTYWVNGKQVNEDWFPKKARSKPIKKYQNPRM
jgi:hypothetical protein